MQIPLGNRISQVLVLGVWSIPPSQPPRRAAGSHRTPSPSVVSLGFPDITHLKSLFLFRLEIESTKDLGMNCPSSASNRMCLFLIPTNSSIPWNDCPRLQATPTSPLRKSRPSDASSLAAVTTRWRP